MRAVHASYVWQNYFMKAPKSIFSTASLIIFLVTNSCSQIDNISLSVLARFEATTPCDQISKSLLQIPSGMQAEMMKWDLTLYKDPKTLQRGGYKLSYTYGMSKQGTRGFMEGATTRELNGTWTVGKGTLENSEAAIYQLGAVDGSASLSFLKLNENVLHLLNSENKPMRGNGAWSYTLNRIDPIPLSSNKTLSLKITSAHFSADSAVFDARTPCYEPLLALAGRSVAGCQLIKCRLILYTDPTTHEPTNFLLYTVRVGKGNRRYPDSGTWIVTQGTASNPAALLYQLKPNQDAAQAPLVFLKADDDVLFLLDKEMNCMSGNEYCSYTFNRK